MGYNQPGYVTILVGIAKIVIGIANSMDHKPSLDSPGNCQADITGPGSLVSLYEWAIRFMWQFTKKKVIGISALWI